MILSFKIRENVIIKDFIHRIKFDALTEEFGSLNQTNSLSRHLDNALETLVNSSTQSLSLDQN